MKKQVSKKGKKIKKSRMSYDKHTLDLALQECRNGSNIAATARKFAIPESTIRAKLQNKYRDKKPGQSTVLTDEEEEDLHTWILHCCEKDFPVTKEQLIDSVKILCDQQERKTPFTDNGPGRAWYERFMKKYKDVSVRISENVNANRAKIREVDLRQWFSDIQTYLVDKNLLSIDPSRIFITDETPLALNPKPQKVLAKKALKMFIILRAITKKKM